MAWTWDIDDSGAGGVGDGLTGDFGAARFRFTL
jgi:hypothetical protein